MKRVIKLFVLFISHSTLLICSAKATDAPNDVAQIPAENFFKTNTEFDYRISPNGKQLAFIRRYTQTYNVVITDLDKFEEIYDFPVSRKTPEQLAWVSDNRLVFGLQGAIYSVNHDGADLRILISNLYDEDKVKGYHSYLNNLRYWTLLKRPRGSEEYVLFRSYNADGHANIHKINIFTGEKNDLYDADKLEANDLYADRDGNVVLIEKVKKENHSFYRLNDANGKPELAIIDMENKSYQLSYDAKSYLNRNVVVHELGYEKDVLYISEKTSSDRFKLMKYNYVTNETELMGSDSSYDIGSPDDSVSLHYDDKNRKLVGYSYNADKQKTVWLDEKFKALQKTIDQKYPNKINQIYDWNENTDKFLVYSRDAKTKGKIIVYDAIKNKAIVQTDYSKTLNPELMKDTEIYKYSASDGTSITSYLTPPSSNSQQKWPLIVMPHGGPFSRSYYGYDGHMQYFSTRGYAVLEPNFRGSIGYGTQHLLSGKHQIADLMLSDLADGVKTLIKENKVDPSQIYILGFSYGGYAAIMSAIKYPELYSAAVSAAAPLDLRAQLKFYKEEEHWFAYEFWNDLIGTEGQGRKFLESLSPTYRISDIKIPLLVFHGEKDNVVPKEQAEEFRQAVEKKNLNIPVRIIQSEGHGWDLVSSNTYFVEKSIELFKNNKKAIQ